MKTEHKGRLRMLDKLAMTILPLWITSRLRAAPNHQATGQQKESIWYDLAYAQSDEYKKPFYASSYYFLWTVIIDRLRSRGIRSVLDLGCGSGQFAEALYNSGIREYRGLDFSNEAISMARRRSLGNFEFEVTDLLKSDWTSHHTEVVVSLEFLEHIDEDTSILDRITSGRYVIASVPNFPYTSHVRHFTSESEVYERYGRFFNNFRVDKFVGNSATQAFFLFEGIKA